MHAAVLVLLMVFLAGPWVFAGGSKEEPAPPEGPLEGEVIAVRTLSDGALELTVEQANGARVHVEVPSRMAETLTIQKGDHIVAEERSAARDGERVRVRTLQIQRGQ